jgi:hypothetical protein
MANFVLLYSGGGGMAEDEAGRAKIMEAWGAWFGSLGAGMVDGGSPFAEHPRKIGAGGHVGDPSGHRHTGYSIIKADSLDEAVKAAKGCPVLQGGGEIEVYEALPMM